MNLSYIDTRYAAFFRFVRAVIVCLFLFSCPVSAGISLHMANNIDLSNNAILDMYQDENGYMWIGTYDGLNLYNARIHMYFVLNRITRIPYAVISSIKSCMVGMDFCGYRLLWD